MEARVCGPKDLPLVRVAGFGNSFKHSSFAPARSSAAFRTTRSGTAFDATTRLDQNGVIALT